MVSREREVEGKKEKEREAERKRKILIPKGRLREIVAVR